MSGHNYHVSIRQIVESQKKLNCINALKLKQKLNSEEPIKVFLIDFSSNEDVFICPIEDEDEILNFAY